MRKNRKGESGQAIAELLAGMLGLCMALLGMLFVGAFGLSNVENLIKARGSADQIALTSEAPASSSAQPLTGWCSGDDGICFTQDDTPIAGGGESSTAFTGQMISTDSRYDLTEEVSVGESSYTSPFADMQTASFFVNAGGLVAGTESDPDPLSSRNLEDLDRALDLLIGFDADISLTETVYMPSLYSEESE